MKLSYNDTKVFIRLVLSSPKIECRSQLADALRLQNYSEGQLYLAIVEHGPAMRFTTDEWFELLSRLPNRLLRSELNLEGLLSQEQIRLLPPVTG